MNSLKYKEFIEYCTVNNVKLNMTGNEAIFAEELINAIEDSLEFEKVMTSIGGRKHIFEKVHQFYKETGK